MIEELIIRTLCDTLPQTTTDAVFLFGQTEDNQHAAFRAAQELLQQKQAQRVLFLNTAPMSGYPGVESWKSALQELGIPEHQLEPIPPVPADTQMLHTRIEAESMVRHAKAKNYRSVVVTAAPFQQPRAFMAAVTIALEQYPQLRIYSSPGKALPWQEEVVHSQGEVHNTRAGLIAGEVERIRKYHAQGDLASVEDVLEYLNKRDEALQQL
ncbi:MAG: YdcF family protein [Hymenobacteraceae bacterium]|nr:YdcF family protein [Hymenobacteraceae bacterium]MDX5481177.1 YdcF family protein [Hymenobacteraceae bacterium]